MQTFGNLLVNDLSGLPDDFDANRDPLTGGLGGCVFGTRPGRGACFDRALHSISGNSFRIRGGSLLFSGERGRWSYGLGAGYAHRRYYRRRTRRRRRSSTACRRDLQRLRRSLGRQLSRTSALDLNAFASWYDSDLASADTVLSVGATLSYNRDFLHRASAAASRRWASTTATTARSTAPIASALVGLRYTF